MKLLIAGKVHHISGLSVDGATDGERQIIKNILRLTFTASTSLLDVLKECYDIPCQHEPPFVPFIDVPSRPQSRDNVIGNIVKRCTV